MNASDAAMQDERRLVRRILAGDEEAFDMFFREHFPRLFRFTCRWTGGDEDLAEDVTQSSLIQAMRRLETWRGDAPLFSWLCTIARREAAALGRRSRAGLHEALDEEALERRPEGTFVAGPAQEARLIGEDLREQVHAALDALPERYACCLEWKYVHDLPVREIATRLGTTEKAAESILGRARDAFRRVFRPVPAEPTAPDRGSGT